jgi:hypothetical protein
MTAAHQDGVHVDLNLSYTASASSNMRRVPNMFAGSSSDATRALFETMPDAHRLFTDEEGANIMNEMIGGGHTSVGSADVDAGEDAIEETIEVVDIDIGKSIGKRKPRGTRWTRIIPRGNLWKMNASSIRGKR